MYVGRYHGTVSTATLIACAGEVPKDDYESRPLRACESTSPLPRPAVAAEGVCGRLSEGAGSGCVSPLGQARATSRGGCVSRAGGDKDNNNMTWTEKGACLSHPSPVRATASCRLSL